MSDQHYMQRALELARLGLGSVNPNPLVGCVIVCDNKIIGEGWHQQCGGPHAEVNAVNSVKDVDLLIRSTVYVTLEPCAHYGKTPPCCDLLIEKKVKRVVICNKDVNPKVEGKGISKMEAAGIEVILGVLQNEGHELNKRFVSAFDKKRPYIILKWAQTLDGFIARDNYDSKWISNTRSRLLVHKWRAEEAAILVGTNTAKYDDPKLNVRDWNGQDPVRIVIDRNLILSEDLHFFDDSQLTICYNLNKSETKNKVTFVQVSEYSFLEDILKDVLEKGLNSLIIEGGAHTLTQFIDRNLWDEARVFIGNARFESGIAAPTLKDPVEEEIIDDDRLLIYRNSKA